MAAEPLTEVEFPAADDPTRPVKLAEYWGSELTAFKNWAEKYTTRSLKIEARYLDEREKAEMTGVSVLNLFWSNTEVMIAALYARAPTIDVSRTFRDPNDDIGRVAANIMERVINNDIQVEFDSEESAMRDAILDRLVVGLGQIWARYEVETAKQMSPPLQDASGKIIGKPQEVEVIVDEKSPLDFVRWEDFAFGPSRRWRDVPWVARRVYMTKDKQVARFGQTIADTIPTETRSLTSKEADIKKVVKEAEVWEIWSKVHKEVFWFAEGAPTILDVKPDPIKFPGFFPCPPPLLASTTTASLLPKCEYYLAQDQYEELDLVTTRIHLLTEAIRVVGVYDKNNEAIKNVLSNKSMNEMIPVNNWTLFAEKGGLKGSVDWFPLETIVLTLEKLTMRKTELIQEIYQILGISDIMRGMSNPNETLGAQNLKAQFGGARIGRTQAAISLFVQNAVNLKAHIIKTLYQATTIMKKSQIESSLDAKYAPQAIQQLKDPSMVYRIKVAADSMASPEWLSEKQQRSEVIQAISQFIGMTMPLIEKSPEASPYLIKILQWAVAGFKGGEELETVLDEAFTAMSQPKPPPQPNPMQIAELEKTKSETANKAAGAEKLIAEAKQIGLETRLMPAELVLENASDKAPVRTN